MSTPFAVQSLVFQCQQDFESIKSNIVHSKLKFCLELERELDLTVSVHAENIFDYVYNLFFVKPAFSKAGHKQWVAEFLDLDFTDQIAVSQYIDGAYHQIVLKNKTYIMELFKIDHDDAEHAANRFYKNLKENVEILKKGVF
jgi:hypothetical protein